MENNKIKVLTEYVNNFEDLLRFVSEGRIIFNRNHKGEKHISFMKSNYFLKNDLEFSHTGYGYKAEDDFYLSNKGVQRYVTFKKGTKARLNYNVYSDSVCYELTINTDSGEYKKRFSEKITEEEFIRYKKDCEVLTPEKNPGYNCIGNFYAWVENGKVNLKN